MYAPILTRADARLPPSIDFAVFAEHGPVEILQIIAWAAALAAAVRGVWRRAPVRERVFAAWLCAVALGAVLRELDAHVLLNPTDAAGFGVRYRIDWWLDPQTPMLPRLLWLVAAIALVAAILAPFVWVAPKFVKLLAALDGAWMLFALGAAAVAGGYACDDLLGRGRFTAPENTRIIEELLELGGAAAFAAGAVALLRTPLGRREARADRLLESTPLARLGRRPRRGSAYPPGSAPPPAEE